jgi:hypothetical protein
MSYVITKQPDGDVSLGSMNGEFVSLSDSISDYATGGYALVGGETANTNAAPNTINIDLWQILGVIPISGQGGLSPKWNAATQKLQIYSGTTEEPASTDLSGYVFQLLVFGN